MSQLGRVQISVYKQRRLVRTFLQCGRIFLTSSAREKRLIASPLLSSPPRAHMAHSRCQFKFTFQALWETTESESARRRTITTPRGVTGLVWGETNYSVFCLLNQPLLQACFEWSHMHRSPRSFIYLFNYFLFFGDACVMDLHAPARCERCFAIYRQLTHSWCRLLIVLTPIRGAG